MSKAIAIPEPNLPWVEHEEDRSFRWLMIIMLVLSLGTGMVLDAIKLPEVVQKNLVDISPRLAKLILEKQKVKPPPPKIEKKKEVKKKEIEKKEKKKKPEKKKAKKKEVKKEDAREVAKKSGLIALSDELADLRESFDLDDTLKLPQQTTGKQAAKIATASNLLTSGAQSSGGIQTDTLNRTITTSELAQRQTTSVQSTIETNQKKLAKAANATQQQKRVSLAKRTADEIERVFQKNKGGIFSLYNRALRKNPSLSGKVVIELTIAPSGVVTAVKILSSELGDDKLERKLVIKIKRFKFTKAKVAEITVTYPIDFLPS